MRISVNMRLEFCIKARLIFSSRFVIFGVLQGEGYSSRKMTKCAPEEGVYDFEFSNETLVECSHSFIVTGNLRSNVVP